jgi:dephospho-CoA kinase
MLKIGLTGGIGCGKSVVAKIFQELGIEVIDADAIVHELLQTNKEIQQKIIAYFGSLDRKLIREYIFKNTVAREWLENLLHPLVIAEIQKRANNVTSPYCILSMPLLFEAKLESSVDRVLVVDCPEEIQISRITQRDKTTPEAVMAIMKTQVSRQERLRQADDIIPNNADLNKLKDAVTLLHRHYLTLARANVEI